MDNKLIFRVLIVFSVSCFYVQSMTGQNLFSHLAAKDSVTNASVKVHQDQRIEALVYGVKKQQEEIKAQNNNVPVLDASNSVEMQGYRVQVYSSNVQKTAKSEAYNMEDEFQRTLPDVAIYVAYHSPFWKVRAGNCRTMAEAQQLKAEIGEALPQLKKDMYVVRDKIKVNAK
jgi:hypothetical protein